MKLNAAAEMLPLSRPEFMSMHPLVPEDQAEGYRELISNLSEDLKVITGFAGVSLQPNSGAAGEYAGLRVIRAYLESIGQGHRNKILIPASAHGTNPASAIQAGFETVTCAGRCKNGRALRGRNIRAIVIGQFPREGVLPVPEI